MSLTKATIKILDGGSTLECLFNPTDYTIARGVNWKSEDVKGNTPKYSFTGVGKTTLSLKLLFDTSLEATNKDVRTVYTDKLWEAARIKNPTDGVAKRKEPSHVLFTWGNTWSFEAVITNISQSFTLFREDGTPIRSEVTLAMEQVKDAGTFAKQNPTSYGTPGQIHLVRQGDRLDLLAQEYYKKPVLWRHIAEYNEIDNPRNLVPGQHLLIPPLP